MIHSYIFFLKYEEMDKKYLPWLKSKGYQTASNSAMYGLPLWKYIPAKFSDVFTQLVTHRDNLFYTIGSLVDGTTASGNVNDLSILGMHNRYQTLEITFD